MSIEMKNLLLTWKMDCKKVLVDNLSDLYYNNNNSVTASAAQEDFLWYRLYFDLSEQDIKIFPGFEVA